MALIAGVAPAISGNSRRFNFEPPPDPAGIGFHPPTWVIAIGVLFLVAAVLGFAPPEARRWASPARLLSAIALIPLVLVLSLALSDNPSTNIINLFNESLVLATPLALGGHHRFVVRTVGHHQHRHRGHHAGRRRASAT